jgi:3''-Phosphoadenosine 5''-phosphosulfate (PAPS) 3''-phosphatase
VGTGVVGTPLRRGPYPLDHHIDGVKYPRPHHATGDSSAPVLEACRKGVVKRFGGSIVTYGGAGNKILAAALGEVSCCIQHRIGGPWDLCAPEAILKAMGGKMTDLFGRDIQIYRDNAPSRCSAWGYLASAPSSSSLSSGSEKDVFHEALVASLLALPEVQEYKETVVVDDEKVN